MLLLAAWVVLLVAKEYCASKPDGNGVLILSEFAGAIRVAYTLPSPETLVNLLEELASALTANPVKVW